MTLELLKHVRILRGLLQVSSAARPLVVTPSRSKRHAQSLVSMCWCKRPISYNFHPAQHLTNRKETKNLGKDNTTDGELLSVDVP